MWMTLSLFMLVASTGVDELGSRAVESIELVRTESGRLVSMHRTGGEALPREVVFVVDFGQGEEVRKWTVAHDDSGVRHFLSTDSNLAGPYRWGITDEAVYAGGFMYNKLNPPQVLFTDVRLGAMTRALEDLVEGERLGWEGDAVRKVLDRLNAFGQAHGAWCQPLVDYVKEHNDELVEEWDLWFDVVYVSRDEVLLVAVRDGQMLTWHLPDAGDVDEKQRGHQLGSWTTHEPVATGVAGPFRVLRAGDGFRNLYVVDERGAIFTGPDRGHRLIGTIQNFDGGEDVLTLLYEDQPRKQIGFLHAAPDGTITPLAIAWDDDAHAADFLANFDSDDTRRSIALLMEAVRE
jgi:hypothetical protein